MGVKDEDVKEKCMEAYKEEKIKVKRRFYQNKKKVSEQFGRKMNRSMNGNMELCLKEVTGRGRELQ